MKKKVFIHSFWGFFTVATFWIGTLLAPSSSVTHKNNVQREKNEDTPNQRGVSLSLMRGTGASTPSKSSSSSDPELEVLSRGLAGRVKSSSSSANSSSIFENPSKRSPLSKTEIKTLVDLAIKSSDPIERRRAFDRLLEEMKSDSFNYEQAMNIRIAMHQGGASGDQWRTFDYAWGANDPASAIKEIDNIPEQYRRGFTSNMLPGLASVEPQTAIGIVEAMEGEMRQQMTGRLIEGLADYDVNFATDYVMDMAESGDPNIAQHMKRLAKEVMETTGLEGGLDWVESLEEGALQATALRSVANEYANERPEDAAKWAEQFIGNDQNSRIFGEIVREWGDQEAAAAWIDSLITSPNLPVIVSFPLPIDKITSTDKISPPTSVQANPLVTPTKFFFSISFDLNFATPKKSCKIFLLRLTFFFLEVSITFTAFLQIFEISFSKFLTPASLV